MNETQVSAIFRKLDDVLERITRVESILTNSNKISDDHERRIRTLEVGSQRVGMFSWNDVLKFLSVTSAIAGSIVGIILLFT